MTRRPVSDFLRFRVKMAGAAALMLLCAACGDGIPKDQDEEDEGGNNPPPTQTGAISVFAGDPTADGTMDGTGTGARFKTPHGLAIDSSGNLYVADQGNFVIRKITPEGVVTTLAGAAGNSRWAEGSAANARFVNPVAVAVTGSGTVYVADDVRIRSITSQGQVSTVATFQTGANVDARSLPDVVPGALAVDGNGNLYATNSYGTRRLSFNPSSTALLEGRETVDGLTGLRTLAPRGVAVDSNGNLIVFDLDREISRWNPNANFGTGILALLAGSFNTRGAANGAGSGASFEQVVGMTVDPQGNVYAADAVNNLVRRITPGGVVTTLAGRTRENVLRTGDLPGGLGDIRGIVSDGKGSLFVTSGNAIVRIRLP